jgi:hypothetical protein
MVDSESPRGTQQATHQLYADLEAELKDAIADFGVYELKQMVDTAEAIRRARGI